MKVTFNGQTETNIHLESCFKKECPRLTAKREAALKYLGDKWILAKKQDRLKTPRN